MDIRSILNLLNEAIEEDVKFPLRKGVLPHARSMYGALICVMKPEDFIKLTTHNDVDFEKIFKDKFAKSVSDYKQGVHPEFNRNMYNMPYLFVDQATGKVKGHEGRHRAAMVAKEGGKRFPCIIYFKTPVSYVVSWEQTPIIFGKNPNYYDEDSTFVDYDYDAAEQKQKEFQSEAEAENFASALSNDANLTSKFHNSKIEVNMVGGDRMKGSPRSNPENWQFDAWKPEDMPPQLVGQFNSSIVVPTNTMKIGVVKGYRHFK